MIRPTTLLLTLGAVLCSAAGQLLLKAGAARLGGRDGADFLLAAARDARVLSGIAAWGASTVCWLYVLRVAPLGRAYLLSSLTYVLVPLGGMLCFGEPLRRPHALGGLCILLGVAFLLAGD